MHPNLITILGHLWVFCFDNSIPCKITSTTEHVAIRKTQSHQQGRAADIRTRNLSEIQISKIMLFLLNEFSEMGARSKRDNKRRVVVRHIGTADHLHIQVSR